MSSLMEMLGSVLGGENLSTISDQVGADEKTTQSAIGAVLPTLIGALSRNGSDEKGATGILGALEKDQHDGGIFENLSGFLGNKEYDQPGSGAGILGHILGGRQEKVQQGVSQSSGLSLEGSGQLMKMLAPMVLGALGKQQKQQGGFDAASLMGFLGGEKESVEKQSGGLMGRFLDQDGDGDFDLGDIAKLAMGKLFGK
jgi:hypothetical protein